MNQHLTYTQIEELSKSACTRSSQVTIPTTKLRQLINEIYELRDQNSVLEMQVGGSKAIVDAVTAAARTDVDAKLSEIQVPRENGPPFRLIDAMLATRGET